MAGHLCPCKGATRKKDPRSSAAEALGYMSLELHVHTIDPWFYFMIEVALIFASHIDKMHVLWWDQQ